jgi:hypothetical protein
MSMTAADKAIPGQRLTIIGAAVAAISGKDSASTPRLLQGETHAIVLGADASH